MVNFAQQYPDRYFDVAIAEQHAVTLAAGMACDGVKPVVAIYSTFLQRGYDQLIHDVALQNLDVTFAIDRAGLVGQDGATHHGAFDLSYMRCIPNMIIASPACNLGQRHRGGWHRLGQQDLHGRWQRSHLGFAALRRELTGRSHVGGMSNKWPLQASHHHRPYQLQV